MKRTPTGAAAVTRGAVDWATAARLARTKRVRQAWFAANPGKTWTEYFAAKGRFPVYGRNGERIYVSVPTT